MNCKYCKDTGMVELFASRVPCTDCPPVAAVASSRDGYTKWVTAALAASPAFASFAALTPTAAKPAFKNYQVLTPQQQQQIYYALALTNACGEVAKYMTCTRASGHPMPHAANSSNVTLVTWEDDI